MIDNLNNDNTFDEIYRRLKDLESASPLSYASITRGALRVASVEGLIVEGSARVSGMLIVSGEELVDGLLQVTGTLVVSGATSITGPTGIDGSLSINGPTVVAGTFSVDGDTTISGETDITGNVTVTGGGRIVVNGGASPATLQDGALSFGTGGRVEADTSVGGARLRADDAVVNVGDVASIRKGSSSVIVGGSSITLNAGGDGTITLNDTVVLSLASIPTVAGTGLPTGTLLITGAGTLRRAA